MKWTDEADGDGIYRPPTFPYGKIGLVVDVRPLNKEFTTYANANAATNVQQSAENKTEAEEVCDFEYNLDGDRVNKKPSKPPESPNPLGMCYSELIVILVEGIDYWVFREEVEIKFRSEGEDVER
jgi:hypothetical protein